MINKLIASSIPILPKWFIKLFSNPYVAGETIDDVLQHIKAINQKGFSATVDILGEHVSDKETSRLITTNYCELYDKINQESLDCNLSVKPTHLGLELSLDTALKNFETLINKAKECSNFLRLDMENSPHTDNTFKIYNHCKNIHHNVGVVLQAYLKRSVDDAKKLAGKGFSARICKGIYKESSKIAYHDQNEIRDNFLKLVEIMIQKKAYACYATHDQYLIDKIIEIILKRKLKSNQFEFQVLYGVPMDGRLEELIKKGYKVRVYVPFGSEWYEYSLRRLKENPNIVGYIIKNLFSNNSY